MLLRGGVAGSFVLGAGVEGKVEKEKKRKRKKGTHDFGGGVAWSCFRRCPADWCCPPQFGATQKKSCASGQLLSPRRNASSPCCKRQKAPARDSNAANRLPTRFSACAEKLLPKKRTKPEHLATQSFFSFPPRAARSFAHRNHRSTSQQPQRTRPESRTKKQIARANRLQRRAKSSNRVTPKWIPGKMETWTKTCGPIPGGVILTHTHMEPKKAQVV